MGSVSPGTVAAGSAGAAYALNPQLHRRLDCIDCSADNTVCSEIAGTRYRCAEPTASLET